MSILEANDIKSRNEILQGRFLSMKSSILKLKPPTGIPEGISKLMKNEVKLFFLLRRK
jgi:hypothetical protein